MSHIIFTLEFRRAGLYSFNFKLIFQTKWLNPHSNNNKGLPLHITPFQYLKIMPKTPVKMKGLELDWELASIAIERERGAGSSNLPGK